ncbi:orotidine-5'-phosphate decarboxylase [Microbulbifer sp. NBRC 101763]|uniref:orotidine-5'-phosphate decarboxylase n=1 Tax=Microbulbifer sp. NBRC 101763 TaxID=1113820 RepID=UPI00333EE97B
MALDVFTLNEMKDIVESIKSEVNIYKIGLQLLTSEGPEAIRYLKSHGKTVFLDLKLHEISSSVSSAIKSAGRHGVDMITVHASGGQKMMESAVEAASEFPCMKVLALTVVTGLNDQDLIDIGFSRKSQDQVIRLAQIAQRSGCHGVVASPQETEALRALLGKDMIMVTPGIRPEGGDIQDQYRIGTPAHAINSGASYIIVGRPIVQADNPEKAAKEINRQIYLAATDIYK